MKRIVNLHLEGGQTVPAECWDTSAPGLIITQGVTTHRVLSGQYSVTHETSGCRIGDPLWDSVELAQMFVDRIKNYAQWDLEGEELQESFAPDAAEYLNGIAKDLQAAADANPALILLGVEGVNHGNSA